MTPSEQAKWEQSLAAVADKIPEMTWGMYRGFMRVGFSADQALLLAAKWMTITCRLPPTGRDDE